MFVRNSLVRDMMFPANFIIESISSFGWVMMNVGFYLLIFKYTSQINAGNTAGDAWDKYQFFVFIATSMFINSIVQMFFMTNADEFSELIRTGGLDFALLKPIDTQFLISLRKVEWASLANFAVAAVLMALRAAARRRSRDYRVASDRVRRLRHRRHRHFVQPHDRPRRRQRVAGPQLVDLRFLVLHHDLLALPDGNLPGPRRRLDPLGVHVHAADLDRRQRAGPDAGQADAGRVLVFGPLCDPRHRRQPLRQPLGFSAGTFKLS